MFYIGPVIALAVIVLCWLGFTALVVPRLKEQVARRAWFMLSVPGAFAIWVVIVVGMIYFSCIISVDWCWAT